MPFGHKAGLPPSKKYLLMRQPLTSVTVQSFPYRNFHRQLLPDVWPPTCKLRDQLHPLDPSGWIVTHILFLHVTNIKSMNLKTHQEVLQ